MGQTQPRTSQPKPKQPKAKPPAHGVGPSPLEIVESVSVSSFRRDSSEVARRLRKSKAGILLTHKGQDDLVVQSVESYEAMLDRIDLLESANEIRKGLAEHERGESVDAMPALLELGRELGVYPTRT